MPMRATTVRFSDDLWALLEREAGAQGVSAAQFIRDATILRVAILAERRGDPEARLTIEQVAAAPPRRPRRAAGGAPHAGGPPAGPRGGGGRGAPRDAPRAARPAPAAG